MGFSQPMAREGCQHSERRRPSVIAFFQDGFAWSTVGKTTSIVVIFGAVCEIVPSLAQRTIGRRMRETVLREDVALLQQQIEQLETADEAYLREIGPRDATPEDLKRLRQETIDYLIAEREGLRAQIEAATEDMKDEKDGQ